MKAILKVILLLFVVITLQAETLPGHIIALSSPLGQKFLYEAKPQKNFWDLFQQFVTQENLAYCSVASSVMILNALGVDAPIDPVYKTYHFFTQTSFFTPSVEALLPHEKVAKQGSTLSQLGAALATFSVKVKVVHANETSLSAFRKIAREILNTPQAYMIVNFDRGTLGEEGGGHMSPIAAYDIKTDRFLLLDVARYRYPPSWIKTIDLWKAMNTIDKTTGIYRGFILIQH